MNYNDQILENKAFKFAKQLIYNLAIGIVIILAVCLIFVYAFQFRPYKVLTGSMEPEIKVGDMVVVHSAKEYKVGDVLKFDQTSSGNLPTVHRLIAIKDDVYICHGDNVGFQYGSAEDGWTWQQEADAIKDKSLEQVRTEASALYQYVSANQIEGKVVTNIANYGTYVDFIAEHKMLFITIILGLWCFTYVAQNEIEMRNAKRLVY